MASKSRSIKRIMIFLGMLVAAGVGIYYFWYSSQPRSGHVKDEALLAGRDSSSFPAADDDYFREMDRTKDGIIDLVKLAPEPFKEKDPNILVKGRNSWIVWTAGNDRLWDTLIYKSAGALDCFCVQARRVNSVTSRTGF